MNGPPELTPRDQYNQTLLANVHPPDWVNPEPASNYNLIIWPVHFIILYGPNDYN